MFAHGRDQTRRAVVIDASALVSYPKEGGAFLDGFVLISPWPSREISPEWPLYSSSLARYQPNDSMEIRRSPVYSHKNPS
jgi:hypothetical protein